MKKIMTNIKTLAALLMAGAALTACSSEDNFMNEQPVNPTEPKTYTMTVQATKSTGDNMETRGLSLDGKTLNATWEQTEVVKVAQQDDSNNMIEVGELKVTQFTGNQATLTGKVTGVNAGKPLWFFLHHIDIDFTGQTGVLLSDENSIEKKYDHGLEGILNGNFTVDAEHNTISLGRALELPAQQAIVKFTLVDKADGTTPINASCLTISDVSSEGSQLVTSYDFSTMTPSYGNLAVTPASPTNVLYVALSRDGSFDCRLTATIADGNEYTYTKTSVTFTAGKYYEVKVKMARKTAAKATAEDLGKVIGGDGNIYVSKASAETAGTTAVAMIAYVGSDTDHATYKHGLAIALANESGDESGEMNWSTAKSTCEGKTAVTGAAWELPSVNQWKTMFNANGGNEESYSGLNEKLATAGGDGSKLMPYDTFWTSNENIAGTIVYSVDINGDGSTYFNNQADINSNNLVRAVLAF